MYPFLSSKLLLMNHFAYQLSSMQVQLIDAYLLHVYFIVVQVKLRRRNMYLLLLHSDLKLIREIILFFSYDFTHLVSFLDLLLILYIRTELHHCPS